MDPCSGVLQRQFKELKYANLTHLNGQVFKLHISSESAFAVHVHRLVEEIVPEWADDLRLSTVNVYECSERVGSRRCQVRSKHQQEKQAMSKLYAHKDSFTQTYQAKSCSSLVQAWCSLSRLPPTFAHRGRPHPRG
jgi:hypothetical protein